MNQKTLLVATILISACSLFSSPSSVVKQLIADGKKGNVEGMVALWGAKAIEEQGIEKIRANAKTFVDFNAQVQAAGEDPQVQNIRETIQGDRARVFFLYRDEKHKDSVGMGFALLKENGTWKLYRSVDIAEEEQPFDSSFAPKNAPRSDAEPSPSLVPTVPNPTDSKTETNSNSAAPSTTGGTISAGVLNSRATSLPKPAYPAAAKAVKASGTVIVNVIVDEEGRVTSATAASGHPLLKAAAEAAARSARFTPTIVGGKRVKVSGTITYEFSPQ